MKALIDEQLSPQIAVLLREAGHDVVTVTERSDLIAATDRSVLEVASSEDRAVVTNNIKDFRPRAAERLDTGRTHAGLILVLSKRTRTRAAVATLARAIAQVLREHPDGLPSGERWIGPI